MSPWIAGLDSGPAGISRGEFGAFALPRVLELLARHEIRSTFFVPGHTAIAYPDLVRRIRDEGHELGHHGWVHESLAGLDREREAEIFERGLEALDQVAGGRPVGYRAPSAEFSPNTIEILLEYGMRYDASLSASDFTPYYLRRGDSWPADAPYVFGDSVDIVEIPFFWGLSDFTYFEFVPGVSMQQSPASAVYEIWAGEFDYAYAFVPGGVYDLCMHPQVIGRGHRLVMVERLIQHMKSREGVVFEPLHEFVTRWREAIPLEEWLLGSPLHAPQDR
jgi:peptidoglycan/xylan/chitin deacetylase (PgdA/CDA1 family)